MDEEEDQRSDVSPERIRGRPLAAGQMSEATHKVSKELRLEIAHVLFIDIVGYSKLLIDEQRSPGDLPDAQKNPVTMQRTASKVQQSIRRNRIDCSRCSAAPWPPVPRRQFVVARDCAVQ
jgi:hypothetical protein